MKIWKAIETAPEAAAKKDWQRRLGVMFDNVTLVGLHKTNRLAEHVGCEKCGCNHRVRERGSGFVGICNCDKGCDDMPLLEADVKVWELSLNSLGREVAKAFGCQPNLLGLELPRTKQVGLFGRESLPIILTIQSDQEHFRNVVKALVTRLPEGFILLAPTKRFADTNSLQLLNQSKAKFFDLESNLLHLWSNGTFKARMSGEELFSPYLREDSSRSSEPKFLAARNVRLTARYHLRRGAGVWRVVFDGKEGEIGHGRGISLVAYLLFNPPFGGMHGTKLAALAFGHEIVQEASLGSDGDSTQRTIQKQARECMEVIADASSSETEIEAAKGQLDELASASNVARADSKGSADKQVRAVRRSIDRLIDRLREAKNRENDPNLALRAFGQHLHDHLRIPSARFAGSRRARIKAGVAGCFTYERPDGIVWEE